MNDVRGEFVFEKVLKFLVDLTSKSISLGFFCFILFFLAFSGQCFYETKSLT